MAINNLIHDLPADADVLNYADSNLTLFQHNLFETNNEWSIVRNYETSIGGPPLAVRRKIKNDRFHTKKLCISYG